MAVKLRLMRMGKKKQPTYRVVAADSRKARNGRFIEIVGTYNPRQEPSLIEIDNEKALHWLRHGAQPSERVQKLLVISGAWAEFTGEVAPVTVADLPPAKVTTAASAEVAEAPSAEESAEADEGAEAESVEAEEGTEQDAEKAEEEAS
ncbi:MAG: 30S ribosomal protein S16 [bacterium]|nr:30S ribosomal protein S16 [bacterium]